MAAIVIDAARAVAHTVETVLEVALIASAAAIGLALIAAVAFLVIRAHRRQVNAISRRPAVTAKAAQAVSALRRRAIKAPKPKHARNVFTPVPAVNHERPRRVKTP